MNVKPANYFVTPTIETFRDTAKIAAKITEQVLQMNYSDDLAFINVNFPYNASEDTPIAITTLAKKFLNFFSTQA